MNSDNTKFELPNGWTSATLGDLLGADGIFCDGDWVESEDQDPGGDVRLIQLADIGDGHYRDRSNRFLTSSKAADLNCTYIQPGDVLIARMPEPLGRTCIFPGDTKASVTVVDVCIVRLESSIDRRWLMHQLNSPQMRQRVAALQSGSTRKRISRANLAKISFPIPPAKEEARIASVVDELFSDLDFVIAALDRVREKLKLYRASILESAVEGRLTAEWRARHPNIEPASELSKRILSERRRRWEEKQLRKFKEKRKVPPDHWRTKYEEPAVADCERLPSLPEGWCWTTLDQLVYQLRSGTGQTSEKTPTAYPVLKSSAVRHGTIDFKQLNYLQASQSADRENFLESGDLLITRLSGSVEYVGCSAVVANAPLGIQYPDRIFCGKLVSIEIGDYLTYCFQHSRIRKCLENSAKSTAGHQRISMSDLKPLVVALPPLAELTVIVEMVERQLSVIGHLEAELDSMLKTEKRLRQSILRDAFEGKLLPQDTNDEPASELLKRIADEREERARQVVSVKRTTTKRNGSRKRAAKAGSATASTIEVKPVFY